MEEVRASYSFYPRKDDPCPNVRWCPHAGGVGISSLVVLANQNEQSRDYLHRTLDAERKRLSESVAENEKLKTELEQVKLELKLERQNKFATNQQKQADPTPQPDPEPEKPKGKRGAPVGHPGWFRPMPTYYDWAVDVPAPRKCPHCQGPVDVQSGIEPSHHLQEDIIDGVYRVVLYRHAACRCGQCNRLVEQTGKNEILLSRVGPFLRSKAAYLRNVIVVEKGEGGRLAVSVIYYPPSPFSRPAKCDDDPSVSVDLVDEPFGKSFVVAIIVKQESPPVSTCDDMIDGVLVLQPWLTRHRQTPGLRTNADTRAKASPTIHKTSTPKPEPDPTRSVSPATQRIHAPHIAQPPASLS